MSKQFVAGPGHTKEYSLASCGCECEWVCFFIVRRSNLSEITAHGERMEQKSSSAHERVCSTNHHHRHHHRDLKWLQWSRHTHTHTHTYPHSVGAPQLCVATPYIAVRCGPVCKLCVTWRRKFCYTCRQLTNQPTIMMIMHYAKINWAQRECGYELSVMCLCVRLRVWIQMPAWWFICRMWWIKFIIQFRQTQ